MIRLHNVSKRYGDSTVLAPLDVHIERGRTTVVIGPSGCGKSTLLRLIVGLVEPDDGTISFDGRLLAPSSRRELRLRMGYVIQQGGLFPHLTARENAGIMAAQLGWTRSSIDARIAELTRLTHFPVEALERYPSELSGGQNQRVALMRALMLDPEVLLLDEPLGALDPMIRFELQEDLKAVFAALGKTVVMVTHDLAEADFFGDRILLMRAGRVLQSGALADMMAAPADPFVEQFIRAQRAHIALGGNRDASG